MDMKHHLSSELFYHMPGRASSLLSRILSLTELLYLRSVVSFVALDNQTLNRPDFETTTFHSAVLLEGLTIS